MPAHGVSTRRVPVKNPILLESVHAPVYFLQVIVSTPVLSAVGRESTSILHRTPTRVCTSPQIFGDSLSFAPPTSGAGIAPTEFGQCSSCLRPEPLRSWCFVFSRVGHRIVPIGALKLFLPQNDCRGRKRKCMYILLYGGCVCWPVTLHLVIGSILRTAWEKEYVSSRAYCTRQRQLSRLI